MLTDVESSTELWEWDRVSTMEAIAIHDRIMRSNLRLYHGYEVSLHLDLQLCAALCAHLQLQHVPA